MFGWFDVFYIIVSLAEGFQEERMLTGTAPVNTNDPFSEVELTISCRNLRDADFFSKSDPMCVVYLKNHLTGKWVEYAKTEVIYNNLNPDFAKKIEIEYHFEQHQGLKFELYDIDAPDLNNLQLHDFLGSCTTSLGEICSNGKSTIPLSFRKLEGGRERFFGEIIIRAVELSSCKDEVTLRFSAENLKRPSRWGYWGWCDPFLEIYKINETGNILVYRSEARSATTSPVWRPFTLPARTLWGRSRDRSLIISCLDEGWVGSPKLIGEAIVNLSDVSQGSNLDLPFVLLNPKKKNKPHYTNSGVLKLQGFHIKRLHSFLDYVFGGMQIHCTVAIDFTASNGNPNYSESLHYIHPEVPNQYEQALTSVVEILQDYDSLKQFPVLGFGARLPGGVVSHNFYVNMNPDAPFCNGVQGVLDAYKSCIRKVQLFYPTNFSPVINHVASVAKDHQDGKHFFILLIVTDGVITDMPQTKKAIVAASTLPMSIIIVGVGNDDFTAMNVLDADVVPLSHNGILASRDIVQFVAFRDFQNKSNFHMAKLQLAKEVLAEIPDQVVGFMKSKNIVPNPPNPSMRSTVPIDDHLAAVAPPASGSPQMAPSAPNDPLAPSAPISVSPPNVSDLEFIYREPPPPYSECM